VIYWLRTVIVSIEAVILLIALLAWVYLSTDLDIAAKSLSLNDEFLKFLMLLPLAVGAWVINECRLLLQEDKDTTRILVGWPDYSKLKLHIWASVFFAAVFCVLSTLPFWVKSGITTGAGLLVFVTSILGQFSLAASVYAARIRVKEITAQLGAP
jgi:hypothetical protein